MNHQAQPYWPQYRSRTHIYSDGKWIEAPKFSGWFVNEVVEQFIVEPSYVVAPADAGARNEKSN